MIAEFIIEEIEELRRVGCDVEVVEAEGTWCSRIIG
jgi:hypothetical protein